MPRIAQNPRLAPSKSVALPVVASVYQGESNSLAVYDFYHTSYSHLSGIAEIEILQLLGRDVKTTTRQRAWEVLVHLCAPIKFRDFQAPFVIDLEESLQKNQRKMVTLSSGTKEIFTVQYVPVVDDLMDALGQNYFAYDVQGRLERVAVGNMGLEYNYATGFNKIVPKQFANKLMSLSGVEGFLQAVKLYICISLRLRGAVGYRLAESLKFQKNHHSFPKHMAMVYKLLHVDVELLSQIKVHVHAVSRFLPPEWQPVVAHLMHFLHEKDSLHHALFANLRLLETQPNLELSGLIFVEQQMNGETYLRMSSRGPIPTLISNLSLYHPLNVTIGSAHWTHVRDMIAQDTQFPAFRDAALQCMHENRLLWKKEPSAVGVERYTRLFDNVRQKVAENEEAILGLVSSIASSVISAPMRQIQNAYVYNIMGLWANAA